MSKKRLCWICQSNVADSGEHIIKRSDINRAFGRVNEQSPLLFSNSEFDDFRANPPQYSKYELFSSRAKPLKTKNVICCRCNNEKTQPFDLSWEQFSKTFSEIIQLNCNPKRVPTKEIFQKNPKASLLNVHLFFVKLFGCFIEHLDIPVDTSSFADSINQGHAFADLYLEFGLWKHRLKDRALGIGGIEAKTISGKIAIATFVYDVSDFAVVVTYSQIPIRVNNSSLWHPNSNIRKPKLVILDQPRK